MGTLHLDAAAELLLVILALLDEFPLPPGDGLVVIGIVFNSVDNESPLVIGFNPLDVAADSWLVVTGDGVVDADGGVKLLDGICKPFVCAELAITRSRSPIIK